MPELPEVETVVSDLRTSLAGRRIVDADLRQPAILRHPDEHGFRRRTRGTAVSAVGRQGKFIVCLLDSGDVLLLHLGMTGNLEVCGETRPMRPHTHVVLRLDDGRELRFVDPRRFGRVAVGGLEELRRSGALPRVGIDPLSEEFSPEVLTGLLRSTRRPLKAALLDQRLVAGLGNIYADEACHRAGIRPTRRCHRLSRRQCADLHAAIVSVLRTAIADRGSSVDDFRDLWNARGRHQERLQVYGRAGLDCPRCGATLRRTTVAGRTTVYCPVCQR